MFQTDVAPPRVDVNNYMASVQSLSALSDHHTVTSFPPPAATPTQFQHVPPTAACFYDQSAVRGRYMETGQPSGYCQPAQWQYGARALTRWNVNGYAGAIADGYGVLRLQPNAGHHAQQQYVNGFGRHMESSSSAWHRGWSARYHPYAGAGASSRMRSVGVDASSTSHYVVQYGVDQRASARAGQSYGHSLGGAVHRVEHPSIVTYDAVRPEYVACPPNPADCVDAAYGSYQMSTPYDHLSDC